MDEEIKIPLGDAMPFVGKTRVQNDTILVTIPANICKVFGIEPGDMVKMWIKKAYQPEDKKEE